VEHPPAEFTKPLHQFGGILFGKLPCFILTAKRWIDATRAVGLISKAGRYGGTYAHKDIAFEFASWISVENVQQLLVLANIEGMNAKFIHMKLSQDPSPHLLGLRGQFGTAEALACSLISSRGRG
jgi:hypothetical protein